MENLIRGDELLDERQWRNPTQDRVARMVHESHDIDENHPGATRDAIRAMCDLQRNETGVRVALRPTSEKSAQSESGDHGRVQ